jgi:hypothetical protein
MNLAFGGEPDADRIYSFCASSAIAGYFQAQGMPVPMIQPHKAPGYSIFNEIVTGTFFGAKHMRSLHA